MKPLESWESSAEAWATFVEQGDPNRDLLLDPVMLARCGDVRGLRVLDVGCGEGRFCRMLAKRGAAVVGIDPTAGLLESAEAKGGGPSYEEAHAEALPFADASFDLVVSYLSLIDIEDYRLGIQEMARVLRHQGRLVVANLSSFVTTSPTGWVKNAAGERLYFPIDNYLEERGDLVAWRGIQVINFHRPFGAYLQAFLGCGFRLLNWEEPAPSDEVVRLAPNLADHQRVPLFYVAEWRLDPPSTP